jgi:hypothetical protein
MWRDLPRGPRFSSPCLLRTSFIRSLLLYLLCFSVIWITVKTVEDILSGFLESLGEESIGDDEEV